MNYEIDLALEQHSHNGFPVRDPADHPLDAIQVLEIDAKRRMLREATDMLIGDLGDRARMALGIAVTMTTCASACVQTGMRPTVQDLMVAARELIEDARIPLDKGLQFREDDQARAGICMLQIVCYGLSSLLGIPYRKVFDRLHDCILHDNPISVALIETMLTGERKMEVVK